MKEDYNKAAALKYHRGIGSTPKYVATGRKVVAIIIIDLARAHDLPIYEDLNLAEILSMVDQYEGIPTWMHGYSQYPCVQLQDERSACERNISDGDGVFRFRVEDPPDYRE